MLKYTEEHEWLNLDGEVATVGITEHAAKLLGDIVFVQLPEVGTKFAKGDDAAVVESVKAASEIYAPVSGTVSAVNETLSGDPGLINSAPDGEGWIYKLTIADPGELDGLMDADAYAKITD